MNDMKVGLIMVAVWSMILLLLSLMIVGAFGPVYSGSFYSFTLPFIFMAGLSFAMAITGIRLKGVTCMMFWITIPLHGALFFPFYFAISRWPGGDDGPGMAWLIVIGGGSCIAALLAAILIILGIVATLSEKSEIRSRP